MDFDILIIIIIIGGSFAGQAAASASDLAERLGCTFKGGPTGLLIAVNDRQEISEPGVFAAGDAASPMVSATLAAASGVMAAGGAHHSLIYGFGEHAR